MWPGEAFYLPDPCELTFASTLLLSNAAISLGNAFINNEISSEYIIFFTLWSFLLSSLTSPGMWSPQATHLRPGRGN